MSLLPLRALYVLSDIIYIIVRYILKYRRNIIRKNLQKSFPEKDEKDLRRIETEFYHYFCDYLVETIKMMTMSERGFRQLLIGFKKMLSADRYTIRLRTNISTVCSSMSANAIMPIAFP